MADPKAPNPFAPKKGAKTTPKAASPFAPKKVVKPQSPGEAVLSAGQTFLDVLSTPLYAVEGFINGIQKGKNPLETAGANAVAWTQEGNRPVTGSELFKDGGVIGAKGSGAPLEEGSPGAFILGLGADILLDPLTYTPGVIVSAPIKAIGAGARATAKAAKLGQAGMLSERIATAAEGAVAKTLKPSSPLIQQYARKPIIKENLIRTEGPAAERLAKTSQTIADKLTFRTVEDTTKVTPSKLMASSIEAGAKATAATFLLDFAKHDITKLLRAEKRAGGSAARAVAASGEPIELRPYDVHVAEDGVYVYDGKNLKTFADEESAAAWSKSQTKTAEPATITRGGTPVLDSVPIALTKLVEDLPITSMGAKEAKGTLDKINKMAAKAIGSGSTVVNAGQRLNLQPHVQTQFEYLAMGQNNPLDLLRTLRERGIANPRLQEASIASHLSSFTITGKNGQTITLGELAKSKTKYSAISKENQTKIQAIFNKFAQDPTIGRITASNTSAEKRYSDYRALVDGLNAGDQVDMKVLTKIVKALDPEAKLVTQLDKAASAETQLAQIQGILVGPGADTVYAVERRLQLIDTATMFDAQGLHMADVAGAYAMARIDGVAPVAPAVTAQTRAEATKRFMERQGNPDSKRVLEVAYNAINKGLSGFLKKDGTRVEGQLVYIQKILDSEDVVTETSKNSDLAVRNTEKAYQAETKAALVQQRNQYGEARELASMVGTLRYRIAHDGVEKGKALNEVTPELLRIRTQQGMEVSDDIMLSLLGARTVYTKAGKKGDKHFLYLSASDTLSVLSGTKKGAKLIERALFTHESDNLDFSGIANAVRMAVEKGTANGEIVTKDLITEILVNGNKREWSAGFRAEADKLAADLADLISNPKVINQFNEIHNIKARAAVDDAINPAESLSIDSFRSLIGGMKANFDKGIDSTAARARLVRDHFMRLVYSSGVLEQQNGTTAMAMVQAMAMIFVDNGRLAKLVADEGFTPSLIGSPTAKEAIDRQVYEDIKAAINSFFKNQDDHVKVSDALGQKLNNALVESTQYYDAVIAERLTKTTKAQIGAWQRKVEKAQFKLDKAREAAVKQGVATSHRYPDGAWVDSTRYDHALAVKMAEDMRLGVHVADDGISDVAAQAVDSDTASLIVSTLSQKKSKEIIKQWTEEGKILSAKAAATAREEASVKTLNQLDEIDQLPMTEGEKASYIMQNVVADTMHAGDIIVHYGANAFGKVTDENIARKGIFDRVGERISGTSGKWNIRPLLAQAESSVMQNFSNISDVMHHIRSEYLNYWVNPALGKVENQAVRSEKFIEAFQLAKSGVETWPAGADKTIVELATKIRMVIDPIFGDNASSAVKNITSQALSNAFRKFGLGDGIGFVSPGVLTEKDFANYLNWVPFGKNPNKAKTPEFDAWEARAKIFREQKVDPFIVLSRMVQAVQFAKTEKAFVMDFANQFGWQRHFTSMDQAVKAGWVKIQGVGPGGSNLSDHLPIPEEGGLFPPYIADEFMAMNREWNQLYNSKAMPQFVRTAMEITGFFKATQTILRPGHHVTNFVGDTTAAMIAGVLNPIHWKQGLSLALEFAGPDAKATWGKNQMKFKFEQLFRGYDSYGRALEGVDKNGESAAQFVIGGKKVTLTKADLVTAMRDRNLLSGNIFQDHVQGLYESVTADALATGAEQSVLKAVASRAQLAMQKVEQPFGSFAAYYGNIIRAAHALKVMQSRSWNSLDEALNAAVEEVGRYHPTIQSLSASERRYPRIAFTYYTWLRVAHNALLDMAMNHTAAMMIPSKFQYQQAEQNGMQPTSFGNPWMDKTSTPNYLNYSVYGPTENGPNGPVIYKRSFLPLDVLDTWNFTWDPARTMDQNAFLAAGQVGRVAGKNANLVAQPAIEWATGTDIQTGKPSQVKDAQTLGDKLIGNIGTVGLLKALGVYTPANKQPGTANPTTPEDQARIGRNWLTGQKETWVDTAQNRQNTKTEQASRTKLIYENYLKSQQGK